MSKNNNSFQKHPLILTTLPGYSPILKHKNEPGNTVAHQYTAYLERSFQVDAGCGEVAMEDVLVMEVEESFRHVVHDHALTRLRKRKFTPGQEVGQSAAVCKLQADDPGDRGGQ